MKNCEINGISSYDFIQSSSGKIIPIEKFEVESRKIFLPNWILSVDKIITSNVGGFKNFTELFGFRFDIFSKISSSAPHKISKRELHHSEITMIIKNYNDLSSLYSSIQKKNKLDKKKHEITINRIIWKTSGSNVYGEIFQNIKYSESILKKIENISDYLLISFEVIQKFSKIESFAYQFNFT